MTLRRYLFVLVVILSLAPSSAFGQNSGSSTAAPLPSVVRVLARATPLRTGPSVTNPTALTVDEGTLLDVVGKEGDWYRISLSADIAPNPTTPRTVYVLARLVEPVRGAQASVATAAPAQTSAAASQRSDQPPTAPVTTEHQRATPSSRALVSSDASLGWCVFDDGGSANPACVTASGVWWGKSWVGAVFESTYVHLTRSNGFPISAGLLVSDAGVRFGANMGPHARLVYEIVVGSGWGRTEGINEFGLAFKPALGVEIDLSKTHAVAVRPQFETVSLRLGGLWFHDEAFSVDVVWRSFRK